MRRVLNRSFLLSLAFAVVGGVAIFAATGGGDGSGAPSGRTEQVLVAARGVQAGTRLSVSDVRVRDVPEGSIPPGALTSPEDIANHYALFQLVEGETLMAAKVSDIPPGSRLAPLIPPGHVAISVAVSDVISTGGFIAPGDRVDVLGIVTDDAGDSAEIVLQDIAVLAVSADVIGEDTTAQRDGRGTVAANPRSLDTTVTVAVTIEEAQRLVQVDEVAQLRLALRPRDVDPLLTQRQEGGS